VSLVGTYRTQLQSLRSLTTQQALAVWQSLQNYREPDRFIERVLPVVGATQQRTAALTEAYLAHYVAGRFKEAPEVGRLDLERYTTAALRGVDAAEVYTRPFEEIGLAMSRGASFEVARQRGGSRLQGLVETDLQLAIRQASADVIALEPRIAGYKRVLGAGRNCGLCIVASTQRYGRETLMPIHPHCGCTVEPYFGRATKVIDSDRLTFAQEALEQQDLPYTREALGRLRVDPVQLPTVKVVQHGELGPTLYDESHRFQKVS
jgi:hypothetical protein